MSDYLDLATLSEICGAGPALKLLAEKGGGRIYVPSQLPDDHWLVALLGSSAARALSAHVATGHGGAQVELSRGPAGRFTEYRAQLASEVAKGGSAVEIARRLRITERSVRRARRRQRAADDKRQGRLF
ncbi:MAG: hypothetical protein WD046_13785 [Paracoccaceae bacterium]